MIVYIHGFGSSGSGSATGQAIRKWFPDTICLDYDTRDPDKSFSDIEGQLRKIGIDNIDLLIGSSLGGFWARHFANRYYIPIFMINPALDPVKSLQKHNFFSLSVLRKFLDYYVYGDRARLPITIALGLDDEIIDPSLAIDKYTNRARIHTFKGEGHRLFSGVLKAPIEAALNNGHIF